MQQQKPRRITKERHLIQMASHGAPSNSVAERRENHELRSTTEEEQHSAETALTEQKESTMSSSLGSNNGSSLGSTTSQVDHEPCHGPTEGRRVCRATCEVCYLAIVPALDFAAHSLLAVDRLRARLTKRGFCEDAPKAPSQTVWRWGIATLRNSVIEE